MGAPEVTKCKGRAEEVCPHCNCCIECGEEVYACLGEGCFEIAAAYHKAAFCKTCDLCLEHCCQCNDLPPEQEAAAQRADDLHADRYDGALI